MAEPQPKKSSPNLLTLPLELRDEIYRLLMCCGARFTQPKRSYIKKLQKNGKPIPRPDLGQQVILTPNIKSNLHLTCRQLHNEYLDLYFHDAILEFDIILEPTKEWAFEKTLKYVPKQVRARAQKCLVTIRWSPQPGNKERPVRFLKRHLNYLSHSLPALKEMSCDFYYPSTGLLEHDLKKSFITLDAFYALPTHISHLDVVNMQLLMRTPIACRMPGRQSAPPWMPEHQLVQHTIVMWKLTPSSEDYAWNGLFPKAKQFQCGNQGAETAEGLEHIIEYNCAMAEEMMEDVMADMDSDEMDSEDTDELDGEDDGTDRDSDENVTDFDEDELDDEDMDDAFIARAQADAARLNMANVRGQDLLVSAEASLGALRGDFYTGEGSDPAAADGDELSSDDDEGCAPFYDTDEALDGDLDSDEDDKKTA